jgi:O-antigen ligase
MDYSQGMISTDGARQNWRGQLRLALACAIGLSLALPLAWISITRLLLFLTCLGMVALSLVRRNRSQAASGSTLGETTLAARPSLLILLTALGCFALSLLWTTAPTQIALASLVKHGRLLAVFLMVMLLRSHAEAILTLKWFALGQAIAAVMAWVTHFTGNPSWMQAHDQGIVFTSYLDQSIIFSVSAGVIWLMRRELAWPSWFAAIVAVAMLTDAMFLMSGRTGFLIGLMVLALLCFWALPQRWRWAMALGLPLATAMAFAVAPERVSVSLVVSELRSQHDAEIPSNSAGWRWNAWRRSVQAVAEEPLYGQGVGAWTVSVHRLQGRSANEVFGNNPLSNPHQEFLLWAVEIGVGGAVLLLAFLIALALEFMNGNVASARCGWLTLAAAGLACLTNSSLYDAHIGDYFATLMGVMLALATTYRDTSTPAKAS